MKIEKAEKLGLCFGVRRAIKLLKEAATKYGEIETLGPVAHNRLLVEDLANLGVKPISHLDQAQGRILAITTHGTSPAVLSEIKTRRIRVIDTTCPIVRKAQNAARELSEAGFDVIIFGDAEHSEVKGLLGWAADKGMAALDIKQIARTVKTSSRLGIISQTTQTQPAFMEFVREVMGQVGPEIEEIRLVNTLCQVTQSQQEAALALARKSQLMIVIGGSNSANTRHLVEICSALVETHSVETADEVKSSWLARKRQIGITAGASTPDEAVEELIDKLRSL
ncbi:MAG: 4-hydroxy-3-methylbut-2-enyl diphosphate reductase [Chloroflexi bacterium RBG_13_51_36]|nr:MAG: 4-hydroxy-3-methylbut-2-enyl diphosphate reductase [Chloroflexi bacterium RBG_13_51_36]